VTAPKKPVVIGATVPFRGESYIVFKYVDDEHTGERIDWDVLKGSPDDHREPPKVRTKKQLEHRIARLFGEVALGELYPEWLDFLAAHVKTIATEAARQLGTKSDRKYRVRADRRLTRLAAAITELQEKLKRT
jgi:hypothetical protein